MAGAEPDPDFLQGKRVAFTGRLASMTRREAARLVQAHGGLVAPQVDSRTAYLVVGQEGWPLRKDGRLSQKLQQAKKLQREGHGPQILQEQGFLEALGLDPRGGNIRRLSSSAELTNLLGISRDRLRGWIHAGLIHSAEEVDGVAYFDFRQVVSARTLCELARAGVKTRRIRKSLDQLRAWLGDVSDPLAQLAVLESNGDLLLRVDGQLVDPSGQRHFDFSEPTEPENLALGTGPAAAGDWFERACDHEDAGRLGDAAEAYRRAMLLGGPDRDGCFNLANVLYRLGHKEQAADWFYQAVDLDRNFVEGWNNLGVVLTELGMDQQAKSAFGRAITLSPHFADAHFNLADLLDTAGKEVESREHWKEYLRHDSSSAWARYARRRGTPPDGTTPKRSGA